MWSVEQHCKFAIQLAQVAETSNTSTIVEWGFHDCVQPLYDLAEFSTCHDGNSSDNTRSLIAEFHVITTKTSKRSAYQEY